MTKLFDKLFGSTVDSPWLIIGSIVLITTLSVLGRIDALWYRTVFEALNRQAAVEPAEPVGDQGTEPGNSSMSRVREIEEKPQRGIPDVEAVSVTDADVVLVIQSPDIFSPQGAAATREIVAAIEQLDYVSSVFWLDQVPVMNLFGLNESLVPGKRASERQFTAARQKAVEHPLAGGQLISDDGNTVLVLIKLDWLFVVSDEDCTEGIKQVAQQTAQAHPELTFDFLVTGRVPMYLTFVNSQLKNRWTYQMIGYAMTGLMALLLFRGIRPVLIVASAASLGVFWTIGLLNYFDLQDNPFNDIVLPILLSLIGLTDGVHLLVEIRRQRSYGLTTQAAARTGIVRVGLACALTSITTAIGFGSLALAHHDIVREFGWACVLGVFMTFLSVIMVVPLACSSRLGRNLHHGQEHSLIDKNLSLLSGLIRFSLMHARAFSVVAIIATIILTSISLTLRPDERRANALPRDSEVARAMRHLDQALGGMETSSVRIEWTDKIPDNSPRILETIIAVDDILKTQPLIGHPLSLRSLIDALPGQGTPADRMPLAELLPAELKRAFYEPEIRRAEINFRVQDLGIAKYGGVFTEVEQQLEQIRQQRPEFSITLRGSAVSRWRDLYQIVVDLALSLGSASVIIFIVLTLAYRSVRIGLISLIPNFFPLAVTGTYLVWTGQALELASVCAFTICLGIAVDDTIHFLTRYGEEREHISVTEAIEQAFLGAGTALIMTSLILVIGFVTVLLSDLRDQRIFATMGALTISSALFADLVFLPALLKTFAPTRNDAQLTEPMVAESELSSADLSR